MSNTCYTCHYHFVEHSCTFVTKKKLINMWILSIKNIACLTTKVNYWKKVMPFYKYIITYKMRQLK